MNPLTRLVVGVNRVGVWASGVILFACAAMIGIEVIARKLFSWSFEGVDELSGYGLAVSSAWAFGFTLLHRAHIRIDTLHAVLPRALRTALDLVGLLLLLSFFGLLAWFAVQLLLRTMQLDAHAMTPLATPLVWPQSLWAAGIVVFVLLGCCLLIEAVSALMRRDARRAAALIGSRSSEEEVLEEVEGVKARMSADGRPTSSGAAEAAP
jgi:TRAP-type C4-dicarboxylate transport system permease small subunit